MPQDGSTTFEHFERTRTATRAKYIDELRPLVEDLRGGNDDLGLGTNSRPRDHSAGTSQSEAGPQPKSGSRGLKVGLGIAAAALVAVGTIAVASTGGSPDPGTSGESRFGPLFTADGASQMLDEARTEFGNAPIAALTIYGDTAGLMREDTTEPGKRLSYQFRSDWKEQGFSSRTDSATFQITDVDPDEVIASLQTAADALDTDLDETGHVFISADVLGQPEFRVSVYETRGISTVTVGSDGQIRKVNAK